jgi:aryl-alcohol dehydrogenase-like predicted oxidoreductase
MKMPTANTGTELAPGYRVPPLIKGGWQLAGGHGDVDDAAAIRDMFAFADAGITAFDCADIYTGVEAQIGRFLRAWKSDRGPHAVPVRIHTKCVPDLATLQSLTGNDLKQILDRSRERLGVESLDLVQFHWWDYAIPGCIDALLHLARFQREGVLQLLGLTNFDVPHLRQFVDAGIRIASHQVQLSILDRRVLTSGMREFCRTHNIAIFCYGALAGGFLHERWLGKPAPDEPLENRSLVKYRLIIDEFGGWEAFQALLATLNGIATRHHATIGEVAIQWVLAQQGVTSVIVGARSDAHLRTTVRALELQLTPTDFAQISAHTDVAPGPTGEVYALERDREGPHGRIMRYGLNLTSQRQA